MSLKVRQPHERRYAKALIHSPPGHGKTTLIGSAQEDDRTYPMLFLDFEGGSEVLAGLDIDIADIRTESDFDEAYEILRKRNTDYQSVGIDSLSEIHRWYLLNILAKEAPRRKNSNTRDPNALEQRDYLIAATKMRIMTRKFRDLPMHVFYAAHSKDVDERRVGRVKIPDMSGSVSEEVSGMMSVVGYLAIEETDDDVERLLLLANYPQYRVKVRTPWGVVPPDELVDPDVTTLLDVLEIK